MPDLAIKPVGRAEDMLREVVVVVFMKWAEVWDKRLRHDLNMEKEIIMYK